MNTTDTRTITVAHSPDSDDAFMHYALAEHKIDAEGLEFKHLLKDIETLNHWAMEGRHEVSAVSIHAYALLADKYALLPHGASMGNKYGPIVVARESLTIEDLRGKRIGIPGKLTTAYLAMMLAAPDFEPVEMDFDTIIDRVKAGDVDAGLLIHEGQLTYAGEGLHKVLDLGEWWHAETGLQLPLGGNAIRKDLGPELTAKVSRLLHESIKYALENREEALGYAMQFARDLPTDLADRFVGMYVNDVTLDYGADGRRAVQLLLDRAFEAGLIPDRVEAEFVG
ncbi:MAG: ABC transporter substrate-binding protein [Acidobacteria bacterium]|nr:ABC transporter substrate-binding protein [Acidobacteriota bacterium]